MTKDVSKQLEKLINKVQETNTYYLMQDNQISGSKKLMIAVIISVLLIAGTFIFINSLVAHKSQSNLRMIARHQLILMYSLNTIDVIADNKKTTNTELGWPEFARKNQGVDNIVIRSQYCDDSFMPWKPVTCNFTYQTIFNNGKASMLYGVTIKEDSTSGFLILHNAQSGVTNQ